MKTPKRITFEERLTGIQTHIDGLSYKDLNEFRKELLDWQAKVLYDLKEINIKQSRKDFLLGLKKCVVEPAILYAKKRRTLMNKVINNSVTPDFLKRFYREAADFLPLHIFQQICGRALTRDEIESNKISNVKEFLLACKEITVDDKGNVRENQSE